MAWPSDMFKNFKSDADDITEHVSFWRKSGWRMFSNGEDVTESTLSEQERKAGLLYRLWEKRDSDND